MQIKKVYLAAVRNKIKLNHYQRFSRKICSFINFDHQKFMKIIFQPLVHSLIQFPVPSEHSKCPLRTKLHKQVFA